MPQNLDGRRRRGWLSLSKYCKKKNANFMSRSTSNLKVQVLFFKIKFSVSLEEPSLQKCKFKISVEMVTTLGCLKQFYILHLPTL